MKKLILLLTILAFFFSPLMAEVEIEGAVEFGTAWVSAEEGSKQADPADAADAEKANEENAVQDKLDGVDLEFAAEVDDFTKAKIKVETDESVLTVEEVYVKSDITGALGLELPVGITVKAGAFEEETAGFSLLTVYEGDGFEVEWDEGEGEYAFEGGNGFDTEKVLAADPESEEALVYSFRVMPEAVPGLEIIYATKFDAGLDDADKSLDPLFLFNALYEKDAIAVEAYALNFEMYNKDLEKTSAFGDNNIIGFGGSYKMELNEETSLTIGASLDKLTMDIAPDDFPELYHMLAAKVEMEKVSAAVAFQGDDEDSLNLLTADVTYSLTDTTDIVGVVLYDMEVQKDEDTGDDHKSLVGIELALVNQIGAAKWTIGYIITDQKNDKGEELLDQKYKSEMSYIDEPEDNAFYISCEIEF